MSSGRVHERDLVEVCALRHLHERYPSRFAGHGRARGLPPPPAHLRPLPRAPAGPADGPSGRRAAVGQARRLQLRARVRRQQDPQARVPRRRRAGHRLRHAGLDRRRAVQPHAPGRGGRRALRARLRARAGELGRLARRRLRPRRQHPAQPDHGRRRPARAGGVRDRLQGELGAGARGRPRAPAARPTRSRPARPTTGSAAWASRAGRARWRRRSASWACSSTRSSSARSPAARRRA